LKGYGLRSRAHKTAIGTIAQPLVSELDDLRALGIKIDAARVGE